MKLLAFDLDGTLLDRQSRLPAEHKQAVARARAAGLDVILVTGRSWRGAKPYYEELGLTGPAICYLGGLTVADGAGRVTYHRPLAPAAWEQLRAFALTEGLPVTACNAVEQRVADGDLPVHDLVAADTAYSTCAADDFVGWEDWNPYTQMAPDLAPCVEAPLMLAVYGERAARRVLEAFPQGLPESQFDLHDKVQGETVLHVWHEAVDKGRALAAHCESRGIAPKDVAAFGDMPMDCAMLRFAGTAVAVPDAHPLVQRCADWVMPLPEAVDRILRGEKG
jgi:hydroxymethylpyrimidine pyrophosphatase-like HAD family hydrolase